MSPSRSAKSLLTRLTRPLTALGRRPSADDEIAAGLEQALAAAADDAPPAEAFDDNVVAEDFSLTLDQMLAEDAGAFQLKLHIISLVQFREAVGDKWKRLSEKAMLIAEGVIAQHLGPGNASGRMGQDFFVLLFRAVPPEEGRRRAHLIVRELGARLLGDQFVAGDEPLALAAEISVAEALDSSGGINPEALDRSVAEERARIEAAAPAKRAEARMVSAADRRIEDRLVPEGMSGIAAASGATDWKKNGTDGAAGRIEPKWGDLPDQGDGAGPATWREQTRPTEGGTDEPKWRDLSRPAPAEGDAPQWRDLPERASERAGADPDWGALAGGPRRPADEPAWLNLAPGLDVTPPAPAPDLPPGAQVGLRWRPTWIARPEESIGAYLARIHRRDPPHATVHDGSLAYPEEGGETAFRLDRALIGAVGRLLGAATAPTARLILPLHWASVADARRLTLLAPLGGLGDARRAALAFDLFGVPDDVSRHDLGVVIQALRPLAGSMLLRVPPDRPRAPRAADCGADAIGLDLDQLGPGWQERPDLLASLLADLRDRAAAAGLGCYAWGLRRRAGVVAAVLGGFAYVNGPGLMRDFPAPDRSLPAPRDRFASFAGK